MLRTRHWSERLDVALFVLVVIVATIVGDRSMAHDALLVAAAVATGTTRARSRQEGVGTSPSGPGAPPDAGPSMASGAARAGVLLLLVVVASRLTGVV